MNKSEYILQNPFHPLDLSPSDLLTIYKRFQQSRGINRNIKHQLSIESIAQLISALKKCRPSEIQQCMDQAFVKKAISWNDFLMFLDQQSQIRQKIIQWLIHQKNYVKYQYHQTFPVKKVYQNHQDITFLKMLDISSSALIIAIFDRTKILLLQRHPKLDLVCTYVRKNNKKIQTNTNTEIIQKNISKTCKNISTYRKPSTSYTQKVINFTDTQSYQPFSKDYQQSDDAYYYKERKNIHNAFNLFKDLSLQPSIKVAKTVSQKLHEKALNSSIINQMKDNLKDGDYEKEEVNNITKLIISQHRPKTIEVAAKKLKALYHQNSKLSYNPYTVGKIKQRKQQYNSLNFNTKKMVSYERKEKEYLQEVIFQTYCEQLNCLGVIYYNMEIVLLKIVKEYNKMVFEQQDVIRINSDKNHKKNETVQAINFYHHLILDKWMMLVLIRSEFKTEYRNDCDSFVKGYEIKFKDGKHKSDPVYFFAPKNSECLEIFVLKIQGHQLISMATEPKLGIHLMSHDGKYLCYHQQYEKIGNEEETYWKLQHQQKFSSSNITLSCLSVNSTINKIVFGTLGGSIIIFDSFSHQYKIKKVTNAQIVQISTIKKVVYILTNQQKLIIYDLDRYEEIQGISVRNEQKLHQKVRKFELHKSHLYCYGTQIKMYTQFVDQNLLHDTRKINNMYTWRVNKIKNQIQTKNTVEKQYKLANNSEIVIDSRHYFIILSEILEAVVISKESLKVKFTLVLDIPYDSKVMKMNLSQDEKLLCLLLLSQHVYIFNIYTQQRYALYKPDFFNKFASVTFLDSMNQYFLAAGTDSGKIALIPFPSIPQKSYKYLSHHKKCVVMITIADNFMVSGGEDGNMSIWTLPFNVLRYQFNTNIVSSFYQEIGLFQNHLLYIRSMNNELLQINLQLGNFTIPINQKNKTCIYTFDSCTCCLIGVNTKQQLQMYTKDKQKNSWQIVKSLKNQCISKIVSIGTIPSEKAVLFLAAGEFSTLNYQTLNFTKISNFYN